MATEIRVVSQDGLSVHYLHVSDNQPLTANFQFKDIQSISESKGNHTFNFRIPSSPNNDTFFNQYFEVTQDGNYNPKVKVNAIIKQDDIEVFEGFLQLTNVYVDDNVTHHYECVIFSGVSTLGQILEGKYLKDHDFSEYEHLMSATNITQSFNQLLLSGDIVYSMWDYGSSLVAGANGNMNVSAPLNVANLKPQIRVNKVLRKILTEAGFTYDSTFFDTTMNNLYMDMNNGSVGIGTTTNSGYYTVQVFADGNQTFTNTYGVISTIINDNTSFNYFNESGNYNTTTGVYTPSDFWNQSIFSIYLQLEVPAGGYGSFNVQLLNIDDDEIVYTLTNTSWGGNTTDTLVVNNISGTSALTFTFSGSSGGPVEFDVTKTYKWIITPLTTSGTTITILDTSYINYSPVSYSVPSQWGGITVIGFDSQTVFKPELNLPDIKSLDFLTSLVKKFNLIIAPDKLNTKHLIIEPYNEWIDTGNTIDWTSKLNTSKSVQLKPTADLQAKSIIFTDALGEDYFNQQFNTIGGRVYGSQFLDNSDNDFGKGKEEITTIFTPTISTNIPIYGGDYSNIVSCICHNDGVNSQAIRLSFYAGQGVSDLTIHIADNINSSPNIITQGFPILQNYKDATITESTECLSFAGENTGTLNAPTSWNGAFSTYWRRFIDETYSKNARILKATFYLDAVDISSFNFNDLVYVKEQPYRINRIISYPLTGSGSCSVELIKVQRVNIEDANGDECDIEPVGVSYIGIVQFANTDTGATEVPTQNCCEAFGYLYEFGICWFINSSPNDPEEDIIIDANKSLSGGQNANIGIYNTIKGSGNIGTDFSDIKGNNNTADNQSIRQLVRGNNNKLIGSTDRASLLGSNNILEPRRIRLNSDPYRLYGQQQYKNNHILGDYGTPIASGEHQISAGADPLYDEVGRSTSGHFIKHGWSDDEQKIYIGQNNKFSFLTATARESYQSEFDNGFAMHYPSMLYFECIVVGHNRGTTQNRSQYYSMRKYSGVIQNTNNSGRLSIKNFTTDTTKESSQFANTSFRLIPSTAIFTDSKYYNDGMFYFEIDTNGASKLDIVDWTIDFRYTLAGLQNLNRSTTGLIFNPTSISGCLLWVDSSDVSSITHSSGSVSQWDDKSGNNYHLTQSTATYRPTYSQNTFDPYIEFDGSDNVLSNTTSTLINVSDGNNTIFVVYQSDVTTTSSGGDCVAGVCFRGRQYHGININSSHAGAGATSMMNRSVQNFDPFLNNISATTKQVVYGTRSGITRKIYDQDGNSATHTNSTNTSQDNFCIGSAWEVGRTPLANFDGKVYEVIVYNTALSGTQLDQVHNYLQTKWNT